MRTQLKEEINIGCASNDAYAQHLGVMICSLLKNCSNPEKIKIFIMDGGISRDNKNKIGLIINRYSAKVKYINPEKKLIAELKECRHISVDAYYRFFIIENQNLKRLLYLDADMIILDDIKKLWELKFEENLIFAVKDPGGSDKKKNMLGIPLSESYFNSGVMLIDCEKWRKGRITQKAIEFMKDNPKKIEYADQDGLNAVLIKKWKPLNPQWNLITRLIYYKYLFFLNAPNYKREDIARAISNPKIIHYASFIKPWYFLDPSPYKNKYLEYLMMTPWRNYKQPDKSFFGIFKRFLYYIKIIRQKF